MNGRRDARVLAANYLYFYYIVSIIKMIEYLPLVTVAGTIIYAVIHDIYVELSEVAS